MVQVCIIIGPILHQNRLYSVNGSYHIFLLHVGLQRLHLGASDLGQLRAGSHHKKAFGLAFFQETLRLDDTLASAVSLASPCMEMFIHALPAG